MDLISHRGHFTDGKVGSIATWTKYLESGKQIHRLDRYGSFPSWKIVTQNGERFQYQKVGD